MEFFDKNRLSQQTEAENGMRLRQQTEAEVETSSTVSLIPQPQPVSSYGYRRLVVWQKAMDLVKRVYALIKLFPAEERYALSDQLRRAVVSIPSNIAEGNGRASNKDYAHFLSIARGSLYETMTQIDIAVSLGYINQQPEIEALAVELRRMLYTMIEKYK